MKLYFRLHVPLLKNIFGCIPVFVCYDDLNYLTWKERLIMDFDPSTATITFLPDGCVEYPALGIISMGETSQHDIEIISDFIQKYTKKEKYHG